MAKYVEGIKLSEKVALQFVEGLTGTSIPIEIMLKGETAEIDQSKINVIYAITQNSDTAAGFGGTVDSDGAARVHEVTGLVQVRFLFKQGDIILFEEVRALAVLLRNVYRSERNTIRYLNVSVLERPPTKGSARIDVQFEYEFYEASN